MSLLFRTLRSGSSGNAQLLCAGGCAVLVDLGLPANTALKEILGELRARGIKLIGALITHEHGDHFSPGPLRVMSGLGVPVYAPRSAAVFAEEQLKMGFWSGRPTFICFDDGESWERTFTLGPFEITPIEVSHNPGGSCFAFEVRVAGKTHDLRAVLATDFCEPRGVEPRLIDADLIYIECNHDPHLLKLKPNGGSWFHLENSRCGKLLVAARKASRAAPQHVCLGHLSQLRNTPTLAMDAVRAAFAEEGVALDFPLVCAPRHHPGLWVEIQERPAPV